MPTQHIQPVSGDHLQDVANALLKARKVVVVTGAGISTNSGIPVGLPHAFAFACFKLFLALLLKT
jgi:hypothetical protein